MELWFWAAVTGTVFAGLSNFYFKQAAARGYNAEIFSLYGSLLSISLVIGLLLYGNHALSGYGWIPAGAFLGGLLAALTNVFKIYALRYIDSTIYFPLFKLLAPTISVMAGVLFFKESFSGSEWIGIVIGLLVPLLLISKAENQRQNNLILGLLLVVITSVTSATTAVANKFSIDVDLPIAVVLFFATLGIVIGSLFSTVFKSGWQNTLFNIKENLNWNFLIASGMRSALIFISFWLMLFAWQSGGTLAIVQTINSMYILIPIVLSIIFYQEHWNAQKVLAIVLSVVALGLFQ